MSRCEFLHKLGVVLSYSVGVLRKVRQYMNAIEHLLKDHEEIGKLFNQFTEADGDMEKQTIAEQVIGEIMKHAQLEEQILFPPLKEKGGEDGEEMVREAIEEHRVTELMMDRVQKTETEDETFEAKFKVLMECTKQHFMEEERDFFPKAKKVLEGELDRLGEEMDTFEKQMMQ